MADTLRPLHCPLQADARGAQSAKMHQRLASQCASHALSCKGERFFHIFFRIPTIKSFRRNTTWMTLSNVVVVFCKPEFIFLRTRDACWTITYFTRINRNAFRKLNCSICHQGRFQLRRHLTSKTSDFPNKSYMCF